MPEPIKEVLFIQHGDSIPNHDDQYQVDPQFEIDSLGKQGEWESEQLSQRFVAAKYTPDIVLSTSYLRGTQTARAIARVTLANVIVPFYGGENIIINLPVDEVTADSGRSLFRELDLPSELADLDSKDKAARAITEQINKHRYEPHWHHSDEENVFDAWIRAKECLDYLVQRPERKIVVITHGGLIKACLAHMLFDDEPEFSTPEKLEAYHAFASHTWIDSTGVVSTQWKQDTGKWQWLISANDHIPGPFGFVRKERHDTPADELLNRDN